MNKPRIPFTLGNDPANQKKYTSHSASPNAKRTLSPARDRRPWRIVASSSKSKPPHLADMRPLRRGTRFCASAPDGGDRRGRPFSPAATGGFLPPPPRSAGVAEGARTERRPSGRGQTQRTAAEGRRHAG